MAKILDSVKELGGKIAGEEIEGDTLIEAVRDAGQKMTGKEIKGKGLTRGQSPLFTFILLIQILFMTSRRCLLLI